MPDATIGVTGAAGYIGSRVCVELLDAGYDIVPIDNFVAARVERIGERQIHDVDVRDRDALRDTFAGVDAVCHLAAISGVEECDDEPELAFDTNVMGTENVAWLAREWELPLVHPISMAVLGDPRTFPITADHPRTPLNQYGLTKAMNEDDIHALAAGAFPAHVYLKSNLYGHHRINGEAVSKHTVINIFVDRATKGEPLEVHKPGTQSRDFIHVKDVARAYRLSLERLLNDDPDPGAVTFPLASGECLSVRDLAGLVQRITEEERGEAPEVRLVENPRSAETDAEDFTVATEPARESIGFEAEHTVEATIREMISA